MALDNHHRIHNPITEKKIDYASKRLQAECKANSNKPLSLIKIIIRHIEQAFLFISLNQTADQMQSLGELFPSSQYTKLTIDLIHSAALGESNFDSVVLNLNSNVNELQQRIKTIKHDQKLQKAMQAYCLYIDKSLKKLCQKKQLQQINQSSKAQLQLITNDL